MRVHFVNTLNDTQVDEAVAVLSTTFCNDNGDIQELVMKCFTGNNSRLLQMYMRAMVQAAVLDGHIFVATEGEFWPAPMVSIGLCFAPGKSLWATKEQRAAGFDQFWAVLPPETRAFWDHAGDVGKKLRAKLGLSTLPTDAFYVNMMLTSRHFQKRGFGTAIMRAIIAYASAPGRGWDVGLGTQSAENRDWYVSVGFVEVACGKVSAASYGDFIPMYIFNPLKTVKH